MPQWGLDSELRKSAPWGIPETWLAAGKVITDPIHGDIYLSRLEQAIVDSSPFQRLRRIRQLGTVHLVYPGATHTRFAHALGALRIVQDLLDIVRDQRGSRHPRRDLFAQWEADIGDRGELERRIAEMTVLARLGALLHDFCHVAYGHSIEDDLGILTPHDRNGERLEHFWKLLGDGGPSKEQEEVQRLLNGELKQALRPLILSKELDSNSDKPLPAPDERLRELNKFPFVADMVGNTICADLIDYLQRDHEFTGLPAALGKRFMTAFYVVPADAVLYPQRMALRISRGGRERKDVISELLKYLRFRYELQERAIVHHAKLAADAMLGKALELWHDGEWIAGAEQVGGAEVKAAVAASEPSLEEVRRALVEDTGSDETAEAISTQAAEILELHVRKVGDDGLLEFLHTSDREAFTHRPAVRQLANDLLGRRLYKRAAQAKGAAAHERIYERFGPRVARKELERQAARYAGVAEEHVAVWLPDPRMRLKIAEVLVDYGSSVAPFNEYSDQGSDIYKAHRELWTITVFVHPTVEATGLAPVVLARLAELMEVEWDRHKPRVAERPADWRLALAAERAFDADAVEDELQAIIREVQATPRRSGDPVFAEELQEMRDARARRRKRRDPESPS